MEENIIFSVEFDDVEIQSFAEANFGRELTDIELNRLKLHWYEDEDAYWERTQLLGSAIQMAMDTEKNNWETVDKAYLDKKGVHN